MAVLARAQITLSAVVDIQAVYKYYKLQSSTSAKPSKPTSINTLPPSGWTNSEPAYTSGSTNTLYTVELTVFTDGSFSYSDVMTDSSYEAAKAAYNKAVAAQQTAGEVQTALDDYIASSEIIVGTQTAVTGAWTGVAGFSELKDGQQIAYWLPYDGSGNATLNLTLSGGGTTGAIPVYYRGTTRATTHFKAGTVIHLAYRVNASVAGTNYTGWWADASYDSGNTYNRLRCENAIKAKTAITASRLIVGDSSGYFHLAGDSVFDITKPILYASSAITAGSTGTNNYIAINNITLRNNAAGITLTQYETCYLVGTLSGNVFTVKSSDFLTSDVPTSDDGYYYISLGYLASTYNIYLYPEHPIYKFVNGEFKNLNQVAYEAQATANGAIERINSNETATEELSRKLAEIEQTLDAITLRVATIANSKAFRAGADISSYVTEAVPTRMNYPAFTDFFIWKACATNIYCSDSLICGTNNYAAHENAVAHCTADDTYYIFEKDNAGEYGWRAMTHDEYMEKSNKYSLINIEDDQIIISSALNNALTNLLINSTGVSVTAGKLFCC